MSIYTIIYIYIYIYIYIERERENTYTLLSTCYDIIVSILCYIISAPTSSLEFMMSALSCSACQVTTHIASHHIGVREEKSLLRTRKQLGNRSFWSTKSGGGEQSLKRTVFHRHWSRIRSDKIRSDQIRSDHVM